MKNLEIKNIGLLNNDGWAPKKNSTCPSRASTDHFFKMTVF